MRGMTIATGPELDGRRVPVLEDLPDPSGKRVLVRATFDRPLSADRSQPLALRRAQGLADTVEWLQAKAAGITVCGPDRHGEGQGGPLATTRRLVGALTASGCLSEGVRFHVVPEDTDAVGMLVAHHDLFVNDTMQDSFQALPSLILPPSTLPSAAGRTLQRDLAIMERLLVDPPRPLVAVLGGERAFDRLHCLAGLVLRADVVLLGGELALPMLRAIGRQPMDPATPEGAATGPFLSECRAVIGVSRRVHHQIVLPDDLVWRLPDGSLRVAPAGIAAGDEVVDIGPLTRVRFAEMVAQAGCVLWSGALGVVEQPESAIGTETLGKTLGAHASVIYGGDALVAALAKARLLAQDAKLLSATDAAVDLLKDGNLPALAALQRR